MDSILLLVAGPVRPEALVGFPLPGLGIVLALVVLLFTGLLVTNLIGRRLVQYWDGIIERIPLVRSVYGGVKSFTESVFSTNNSFRKVVVSSIRARARGPSASSLLRMSRRSRDKTGVQHACVYVPTTPNPTSGFIVIVPRADVVELDMSVDAAMKMIITWASSCHLRPRSPIPRLPDPRPDAARVRRSACCARPQKREFPRVFDRLAC